jgi:alpha-glucosidase
VLADFLVPDGGHPLFDRDDLTEIYAQWRRVFDEYDPPRFGVAEAAVRPERRRRYAAPTGLGQAFNFSMQEADWDEDWYRKVIDQGLADMHENSSSTTWVLGCHDTVRVSTRYGFATEPGRTAHEIGQDWLVSDGREPPVDADRGRRRARAAALILLALPGSTYLYQGDELGLPEVGDLPPEVLQDPVSRRSGGRQKGRDGCRVPLPWTGSGSSFGFGPAEAHLPQPASFAAYAVEAQQADPASTLSLHRAALHHRRILNATAGSGFTWCDRAPGVLHFRRPGGWHCVANFSSEPVPLPAGAVLVASASPLDGTTRLLPPDTSAWVIGEP